MFRSDCTENRTDSLIHPQHCNHDKWQWIVQPNCVSWMMFKMWLLVVCKHLNTLSFMKITQFHLMTHTKKKANLSKHSQVLQFHFHSDWLFVSVGIEIVTFAGMVSPIFRIQLSKKTLTSIMKSVDRTKIRCAFKKKKKKAHDKKH